MQSLKSFLEFRIEKLIRDAAIPVDLNALCSRLDVAIEEREMIPEAAMHVADGRFRIFLQSNFSYAPGAKLRRRFSLAHEIGHTLFYDLEKGKLRPRKDSPRGDHLEAACHTAASMILIPSTVLHQEIKKQPPNNAAVVMDLANRFEVSAEVMLRRLNDLAVLQQEWAPVLVRQQDSGLTIEFAAYPPWLRSSLAQPSRGATFRQWFRGSEQADGKYVCNAGDAVIEATPFKLPGASLIFELRRRS